MLHYINFASGESGPMKLIVATLLSIPGGRLVLQQALPVSELPGLRSLLDFGVTAVVAVFVLWVYSRQVGDWQKQFLTMSQLHAVAMTEQLKRYETQTAELKAVIAENNLIKGKLLEAVERVLDVYPCPYARDLSEHPAARQRHS